MKSDNVVQVKSFEFAIEIVYKYLCDTKKEYVLMKLDYKFYLNAEFKNPKSD
jgi:hypothetical protein